MSRSKAETRRFKMERKRIKRKRLLATRSSSGSAVIAARHAPLVTPAGLYRASLPAAAVLAALTLGSKPRKEDA
jgi:hypothetical protein